MFFQEVVARRFEHARIARIERQAQARPHLSQQLSILRLVFGFAYAHWRKPSTDFLVDYRSGDAWVAESCVSN
ncbi:TPA: hypothetical protein HA318_05155 [Candidatus Micrarchaeota archaeon]|nr:hypothetical protein [Candidatus Micrarchaeota archaeon]